jgi:hypothetical protein
MAWTASLPAVVTGNATKASDYNNLLNNLLFRRDTATGDTTQLVVAVGSDGSAATPAIKRNADGTGFYFAAGAVNISCAGLQVGGFSSGGTALTLYPSTTTTTTYGLTVAVTTFAASGVIAAGINIVNLSMPGGAANNPLYGINIGTTTTTVGGNTYGISMGAVTAVQLAYGINIGTMTCGATQSGYGVYVGNVTNVTQGGGALTVCGLYINAVIPVGTPASGTAAGIYIGAVGAANTTINAAIYASPVSSVPGFMGNSICILNTGGFAGKANSNTFTGLNSAITGTTNILSIKTSGAAANQTGWIQIYVGTVLNYIPYWAAI